MSLSLLASSSFRKSLVFCARSFLCVSVSRWYATMSDATLSSCGTSVVRSMAGAWLARCCNGCAAGPYFSTRRWPSGTCSRRPPRLAPRRRAVPCPARSPASSAPPCLRPPFLHPSECVLHVTYGRRRHGECLYVSPQLPASASMCFGGGYVCTQGARECCGAHATADQCSWFRHRELAAPSSTSAPPMNTPVACARSQHGA
jgi:hypothetical protein